VSLTLSPTLQAAQDGQSHNPIIEILSSEGVPDIPFAGQRLTSSTANERNPSLISHSSGALVTAFMRGPTPNAYQTVDLIYAYTDSARTMWTFVTFILGNNRAFGDVALCELAGGTVGIVYTDISTTGGTCSTKYRIVTVDGLDLDPAVTGTIFSQASSIYMSGPAVIRLADDSYLMAYALYDAGTGHYHLYSRTSADFLTWSAPAEIDTSGITATKRLGNPSLLEISSGNVLLLLDVLESTGPSGEECTNCYYEVLTSGVWSSATALTSAAGYAEKYSHAVATLKDDGSVVIAYNKEVASLKMDSSAAGWRGSENYFSDMHLDTATGKLYVTDETPHFSGQFRGESEIDTTSWEVSQAWDTGTATAFDTEMASEPIRSKLWRGSGKYVIVGEDSHSWLNLLNAETDEITHYYFCAANGHAVNISGWDPWNSWPPGALHLSSAWVDETTSRIYLVFNHSRLNAFEVGYLDLNDTGPTYAYTRLYRSGIDSVPGWTGQQARPVIYVYPSDDVIIINYTMSDTYGDAPWAGATFLVLISTGTLWKRYADTLALGAGTSPDYPYLGLKSIQFYGGKVYGGVKYLSTGDDADKRGLCIIDPQTDVITFRRPDTPSVDDYMLEDICMTDDDKMLIAAYGIGIYLYDPATDGWTLYDNDTVPGLTTGPETFFQVAYDPVTRIIYTTVSGYGVVAFSRDGALKQSWYTFGPITAGVFSGSTPDNLVQGFEDYDAVLAAAGGDLYAVWTNQVGSAYHPKWAKDANDLDLGPYIVRGGAVEIREQIDPMECVHEKSLTFSVARGDLFDPTNAASLLRGILDVGRTLTIRLGEKVSGADYWQNQGFYLVTQNPVRYGEIGSHPTMEVTAEDKSVTWEQDEVEATSHYAANSPEVILADVLHDHAGIPTAEIAMGAWTGTSSLTHQWIKMSLKEIVSQLCQRFGYYVRYNVDGTIDARKVSDDATVDHAYTTTGGVISWSPGKKDNDFVNRVVIEGEELDYIEVLTTEERVASFNASHRWNTCHNQRPKKYTVWYSDDRSRRCRFPRMVSSDMVTSLMFSLLGKCSQSLADDSHTNPDGNLWDRYCTINVDSPDLTPELIAALGGLVASYFVPDIAPPNGGPTKRIGSYLSAFCTFLALNILSATGNFSAEVWAQPVGFVRRKVASVDNGETNDYEAQRRTGRVIQERDSNPLCYSAADCHVVAAHRMMCHKRGRAMVSFEKATHLQDETGDTISVLHPISGDTIRVFITGLSRAWTMPENPADEQGRCVDSIEGWAI
jgi:hypothetical protein